MKIVPRTFRQHSPTSLVPRIDLASNLTNMRREMNNLMNDFLGWGDLSPYAGFVTAQYPMIDVREDDEKYFIDADLPGISEKDISLDIRNNILTISGKQDLKNREKDEDYVYLERTHKSFSRDIYLSDDVDVDNVLAEMKSGVLHVELKKNEKSLSRHKKIPIKQL